MSLTKATFSMIKGAPCNVIDFGADPTGLADSTSAIQAAIDTGKDSIYIPEGTYKVTSTITVSGSYVHVYGAGKGATTILFAPTANGICFKFSDGATMMTGGSIKGLRFYSNDSTYAKTALNIIDVDDFSIEDIIISGSVNVGGTNFWTGGTASTGIKIQGRDQTTVRKLDIAADLPINIADNPNNSIDIDHFHFSDCYLLANANPIIKVESGVNLTNVTFDGYQAWNLGTDGFSWIDTTSTSNSYNLSFHNVRGEQGSSTSAYLFNIQQNSNLQNLSFDNIYLANDRNGFYLRNVQSLQLSNVFFDGSARKIIDIDATVDGMTIDDCLWNPTATATVSGQTMIWSSPKRTSTDALPPWGYYASTSNTYQQGFIVGSAISEPQFSITTGNVTLFAQEMCGFLTIINDLGQVGTFIISGVNHTTTLVSDPSSAYSVTPAAANKTSVYWSAGNTAYEIDNETGSTRKYKIALLGSYVAL